jgi:hypothetical protein
MTHPGIRDGALFQKRCCDAMEKYEKYNKNK